jgi:hypothetical protein
MTQNSFSLVVTRDQFLEALRGLVPTRHHWWTGVLQMQHSVSGRWIEVPEEVVLNASLGDLGRDGRRVFGWEISLDRGLGSHRGEVLARLLKALQAPERVETGEKFIHRVCPPAAPWAARRFETSCGYGCGWAATLWEGDNVGFLGEEEFDSYLAEVDRFAEEAKPVRIGEHWMLPLPPRSAAHASVAYATEAEAAQALEEFLGATRELQKEF